MAAKRPPTGHQTVMPRSKLVPRKPTKKRAVSAGRPRLVNQVLLDRMVALRHQGFSHQHNAEKVQRSERTVRRYLRGVVPKLELPAAPKRVDVLARCTQLILQWLPKLKLDTQEVDVVLKKLRKTLEQKDPLTLEWLATNPRARGDFLVKEFLRSAMSDIRVRRDVQRIKDELGGFDDEVEEEPSN